MKGILLTLIGTTGLGLFVLTSDPFRFIGVLIFCFWIGYVSGSASF